MPIFATDTPRLSNLVKHEYDGKPFYVGKGCGKELLTFQEEVNTGIGLDQNTDAL